MTKLSDYYAVVLTNKWFYLSILATILAYIGSNFILKGKILNLDLHQPWKIIQENKERVEEEVEEVRTSGYLISTSQLFSLSRKFLTLRRGRDSNPRYLSVHGLSRTAN